MQRPANLGELGILYLWTLIKVALYKSFILTNLEYFSPLLLGVGKVQANHYIKDSDRAREITVLLRTLKYM